MAFLVECPFCKQRAKVPDRARGAIGKCPKCASSFTLASVDDQVLPEAAAAGDADESTAAAFGAAVSAGALVIAWFFPSMLGPAYEHSMRPSVHSRPGLHAIPLAGAPELAEVPPWVDAAKYALERDGLRLQVMRVSRLSPIGPK